jgi:hypothetical protein
MGKSMRRQVCCSWVLVSLLVSACAGPDALPPWATPEVGAAPEPAVNVNDDGDGDDAPAVRELCAPGALFGDDRPDRVRVVVAVDLSASMQFVDEAGRGRSALYDLQLALAQPRDTWVSTLGMSAATYAFPGAQMDEAFFPGEDWVEPFFLNEAATFGDMQGALDRAVDKITRDLERTPADLRAETTYLVLVITDGGGGGPTCCAAGDARLGARSVAEGCPALAADANTAYCGSAVEPLLCSDAEALGAARATWAAMNMHPQVDATAPLDGLEPGQAYNRPETLDALAAKLRALSETHGAREVRLSIGLLDNPDLPDTIAAAYDIDTCTTAAALAPVAAAGGGRLTTFDARAPFTFESLLYGCSDD